MNTTTQFARILVGYVTIGIVFGTALSGGPCGKKPQAVASQAVSKPHMAGAEQHSRLLSFVNHVTASPPQQSR